MANPTVYLVIGPSAIAFDERGEVVETVEWNAVNQPNWDNAGICDHRGAAGATGFSLLYRALLHAERNAELCGFDINRVPAPEV